MTTTRTPSKQDCVSAFWAIIGPGVVDLIRDGKADPLDYPRETAS